MNLGLIPLLALLMPVVGATFIGAFGQRPNARETATLVTACLLFLLVLGLVPEVLAGARPRVVLAEPLPGLSLALAVEPLGLLFALVASMLWIVTSVYSIGYMRAHRESHQTRFYVCFAVALAATVGVAFAANLLTLFIFYEVLTLSTYPLVIHHGDEAAKRGGRVYLGVLLGTSIGFFLLAMIATWLVAGTLDFRPGGVLAGEASGFVLSILLVLYVFGIGKAAIMPFHRWLPAAMVAPTPVSALLHAVAVVKAGVFTILKIVIYLFGLDTVQDLATGPWLAYLAGATILIASLIALTQDNLKLRLAYSTVSQLSYIVMGALLANPLAAAGAGMHIVMHAFGKITLFFCAGAILVAAHKTKVSELRGLGRRMPITFGAFFIASLSIIGLPPAGGLWSKWYLALGTLEAGEMLLLGVLMVSSLLNVMYLLIIPVRAFFSAPADDHAGRIQEAPSLCLAAIIVTTLSCVVLFFYPEPVYRLMQLAIASGAE